MAHQQALNRGILPGTCAGLRLVENEDLCAIEPVEISVGRFDDLAIASAGARLLEAAPALWVIGYLPQNDALSQCSCVSQVFR